MLVEFKLFSFIVFLISAAGVRTSDCLGGSIPPR